MSEFVGRYNPIKVIIHPLDIDGIEEDEVFGRSSSLKRKSETLEVEAQINWDREPQSQPLLNTKIGDTRETKGHLIFKKSYIDSINYYPKKGDILTMFAGIRTNHKLVDIKPYAPLNGYFLLIKAEFRVNTDDRQKDY